MSDREAHDHYLHLIDPAGPGGITHALCGAERMRLAGDPQGHWSWHDTWLQTAHVDCPPGPEAVARRDGLTICPQCREAQS